jgi:hypothetical protein
MRPSRRVSTRSSRTSDGQSQAFAREAIAFHIEGLREDGEPVPEPTTVAAAVVEIA